MGRPGRATTKASGWGLAALALLAWTLQAPAASAANCLGTSTGLKPLTDLGPADYRGHQGGLYPGGSNKPGLLHKSLGAAMAKLVTPRNAMGLPDPAGEIGFLSIGMSNTQQEFGAFMALAHADAKRHPSVHPVNGAEGGWGAPAVAQAGSEYWQHVERKLSEAHVTDAQVQAVWLKEAVADPTGSFPTDAQILQGYLEKIVRILAQRFPNLGPVYLSSRIYGGYATTTLNPEPYAYDSGFAVKWLIEDQIDGRLLPEPGSMPWIGWGPYLWADGERPRSDGLVWHCTDFRSDDGTHPSDAGKDKVARKLLHFLDTDETAKTWYVRGGVLGAARTGAHAVPLTPR